MDLEHYHLALLISIIFPEIIIRLSGTCSFWLWDYIRIQIWHQINISDYEIN